MLQQCEKPAKRPHPSPTRSSPIVSQGMVGTRVHDGETRIMLILLAKNLNVSNKSTLLFWHGAPKWYPARDLFVVPHIHKSSRARWSGQLGKLIGHLSFLDATGALGRCRTHCCLLLDQDSWRQTLARQALLLTDQSYDQLRLPVSKWEARRDDGMIQTGLTQDQRNRSPGQRHRGGIGPGLRHFARLIRSYQC